MSLVFWPLQAACDQALMVPVTKTPFLLTLITTIHYRTTHKSPLVIQKQAPMYEVAPRAQ